MLFERDYILSQYNSNISDTDQLFKHEDRFLDDPIFTITDSNIILHSTISSNKIVTPKLKQNSTRYIPGIVTDDIEKLINSFSGLLNKITNSNYNEILNELKNIDIYNISFYPAIANRLFNKILNEHEYIKLYVKLCIDLSFNKLFINELLILSNNFFNKFCFNNENTDNILLKKQNINNIIFIGELLINKLINPAIIFNKIIPNLLNNVNDNNIEILCNLLNYLKQLNIFDLYEYYFKINKVKNNPYLTMRIKFMIEDVIS
jgi:hypothetical protein